MVNVLEIIGFDNLFNISGILSKVFFVILLVVFSTIAIGAMWFGFKFFKRKKATIEVAWWEEIHNDLRPLTKDYAEEITVPGTSLKLFYVKDKDLWLPRFARSVDKNLFYVAITPEREIVNFTLGSLSKDRTKIGLHYDHTDMRWAAENAREFVKRNYRDKATTWWKEYKEVITLVLIIFMWTVSLAATIYMLSGLVQDIGSVASQVASYMDRVNACAPQTTSGIAPAG